MNKTTKIALNYGLGIGVAGILFWNLYTQAGKIGALSRVSFWPVDTVAYFIAALLMLPANLGIEVRKWQLLVRSATPINYAQACKSVLGGITCSLVTPNRIGEYPGRMLLLAQKASVRLVSVSVLGGCAQLLTVFLFGTAGLFFHAIAFPDTRHLWFITAATSLSGSVALLIFYFRFESWSPYIERVRWLKKWLRYGGLLRRFTLPQQVQILGMSALRFIVYNVQYYLLLRWMHVHISPVQGLLLCALFFWAMAVIPSIALAELGVRGTVGIYLFGAFAASGGSVLIATFALWCINLVLPALLGCVLLLRARLLR